MMERRLLEVLVAELRHLEHRDARLATEDRLQVLVGVDLPAVLGILQVLLLDIAPELLGHFRARKRSGSDDRAELSARGHRLHERCIGRTLRRLLGGLLRTGLRRLLGATLLRRAFLRRGLLGATLL